jgi:hypothetical protein
MFSYKHMSFTILVWHLLVHSLTFLFVVFIVIGLCQFHIRLAPCFDYISWVPPPLPPKPLKKFLVCDLAIVISNPFKFFHYYLCTFCNMATFLALGCLDFTTMVDNSWMTFIYEHCLCVMFVFQLSYLHISKDVSHDFKNFVLNFMY